MATPQAMARLQDIAIPKVIAELRVMATPQAITTLRAVATPQAMATLQAMGTPEAMAALRNMETYHAPLNSTAQQAVVTDQFTLFPQLPNELQEIVWMHALPPNPQAPAAFQVHLANMTPAPELDSLLPFFRQFQAGKDRTRRFMH
jgi:hypothetical protein